MVGASKDPGAATTVSGTGVARIGVANMNNNTRLVTAGGSRGNMLMLVVLVLVSRLDSMKPVRLLEFTEQKKSVVDQRRKNRLLTQANC